MGRIYKVCVLMTHVRIISAHILLGTFLFSVFGCATTDKAVVQPAKPSIQLELSGPYDRDIPETFIARLHEASAKDIKAVPYLFMAIGVHFETRGDDTRSIHFYDRAAEEFSKKKNLHGEGLAAMRKIKALCKFGKMEEAGRLAGDREQQWRTLPMNAFVDYAYGYLFLTEGNYQDALSRFNRAIDNRIPHRESLDLSVLMRDSENGAGKALIYAYYIPRIVPKRGWIEQYKDMSVAESQNMERGIQHLRRALVLNEEIRQMDRAGFMPQRDYTDAETDAHSLLGLAEGLRGNQSSSDRELKKSLRLSQIAGDPIGEAESLFFLNQLCLFELNIEEGLKTAQLLNLLADRYRLRFYQIWSKYLLSHYYTDTGKLHDARAILQSALVLLERPGWLPEMTGKPYHFFSDRVVYEFMLELLIRQGDDRGGLEMADRARAKEVADVMAGEKIGKNQVEEALLADLRRIAADIADIQRKMFLCADGSIIRSLTEKMEQAEMDYNHVLSRIQKENHALHALVSVQAADSMGIQKLLDENTTLFSYFVTDHYVYVWVMNKDRLHQERFDMERDELQRLVLPFFDAVKTDDKGKVKTFSTEVYDNLLKPVMMHAAGDRLGIIAHDVLNYLPFAALRYRGKYLVEGFSIFYVPHLSALKDMTEKRERRDIKILIYGNPAYNDNKVTDSYMEAELARIKKRFPETQVITGDHAAISKIEGATDAYNIIHFAARAVYDPADPLNSFIGQDCGRLTPSSIFKLPLSGRAVVLSASETRPDQRSTGSDIVLVNEAFLYAGKKAVVSSLWYVGDMIKVQLIDSFYGYLGRQNDFADSLRNAQLDLLRKGYAPYYWAPFKLMGN